MSIDIRLPSITANTDAGRLNQLQSYVYQLVEQLNWAINLVNDSASIAAVEKTILSAEPSEEEVVKNFQSMKSLIIKSADIVNAYYDMLTTRFEGLYVSESDFGTYQQQTEQTITQTSTEVRQNFTEFQELKSEIGSIVDSQAWVRTGLLDYKTDGTPIYGMEIGQKTVVDGDETFDKFSRFTAEGTYFYLPGSKTPVAWMTGTKLFINNLHVVNSVQLGSFFVSCSNGLNIS